MSRRREVQDKLHQLGEIGEIMRSMKNLALMETRKLGRYAEAQRRGIDFLESAAADFLHHFPQPRPSPPAAFEALLVIGTERGFCGEFNEQLLEALAGILETPDPRSQAHLIVAVGGKLCDRLSDRDLAFTALDGAMVAEDLPHVASRIALSLADLQRQHPDLVVSALVQSGGGEDVQRKALLPPFLHLGPVSGPAHPPLLYMPPAQFYSELVQHYLAALLNELLHVSLLQENELRVRHLEGALQRLEEKTDELHRRSQALRQEEITEEIEIILLSVEGLRG